MTVKGDTLQSAGTTAMVLKAMGRLAGPVPLSRIAQVTGLPPAKAHRYLQALIGAGLAEQDEASGHYGPGPELVAIGLAALGRMDIVATASPVMAALRDEREQTCILSVWGNAGPTVVRVSEARGTITTVTRLGSVLPMRSATGLMFAAMLDPELVAATLPEPHAAANALAGLEAIREAARRTALASIDGLVLPGIAAVAAPIFDAFGQCTAVLCALGPSGGFDADADGPEAVAVRAAAEAISYRLGHVAAEAAGRD